MAAAVTVAADWAPPVYEKGDAEKVSACACVWGWGGGGRKTSANISSCSSF